jgi:uncharacterized ParB-like nuclease family protein
MLHKTENEMTDPSRPLVAVATSTDLISKTQSLNGPPTGGGSPDREATAASNSIQPDGSTTPPSYSPALANGEGPGALGEADEGFGEESICVLSPLGKTQIVPISEIDLAASIQMRAEINPETVSQYAEAMAAGEVFPPIVIFKGRGRKYLLADGFHRLRAAQEIGRTEIRAEVNLGNRGAALRHALQANACHGLPRTTADKQKAVRVALEEWPKLSDAEIARICAVSRTMVRTIRERNRAAQGGDPAGYEKRLGRDGKEYAQPKRKPRPPGEWATPSDVASAPAATRQPDARQELNDNAREAQFEARWREMSAWFSGEDVSVFHDWLLHRLTRSVDLTITLSP